MNAEGRRPIDEQWTTCSRGHLHWGSHGGAGILFRYQPEDGAAMYLLEQRSRWVDEGGTWGIPGGALKRSETIEEAARREAEEEIGGLPDFHATGLVVQHCGGGWTFSIITADVDQPFDAYCVRETDATGWFTTDDMRRLHLHPGIQQWLDEHGDD
jgi:8-oxo-dGTP diphosphatase